LFPMCLCSCALLVPSPGKNIQCESETKDDLSRQAVDVVLLQRKMSTPLRTEVYEDAAASSGGPRTPTVVVVKTYGDWTPWVAWLVERYSRQLARVDIQLAVLRDVTKLEPNLEAIRASSRRFGNATAPVCEVSWPAARKVLGDEIFDSHGHHWKADPHILTTVFELLWWKECAPLLPKKDARFVWMAEHDAFFNGDLARFVQSYRDDDADYVARGFRITGSEWWLYSRFDFGLKNGLKTFGVEDDLVRNVHPLPEVSEGKCRQKIKNNKNGLLLAQDHVTRYSARYFKMLASAAGRGIAGPGEAFKSTLCASGLGLDEGESCSMTDFAPIRGSEDWISPVYCWVQVQSEPGRKDEFTTDDLPCEPQWLDKWVHPVKLNDPGLRLQEC